MRTIYRSFCATLGPVVDIHNRALVPWPRRTTAASTLAGFLEPMTIYAPSAKAHLAIAFHVFDSFELFNNRLFIERSKRIGETRANADVLGVSNSGVY